MLPTCDEATQTENCVATQTEIPKSRPTSPKKKMPQCWDTFGTIGESRMFDSRFLDKTCSFINKAKHNHELVVLREAVKRLERTSREQLQLENQSQETFECLFTSNGEMKRPSVSRSFATSAKVSLAPVTIPCRSTSL